MKLIPGLGILLMTFFGLGSCGSSSSEAGTISSASFFALFFFLATLPPTGFAPAVDTAVAIAWTLSFLTGEGGLSLLTVEPSVIDFLEQGTSNDAISKPSAISMLSIFVSKVRQVSFWLQEVGHSFGVKGRHGIASTMSLLAIFACLNSAAQSILYCFATSLVSFPWAFTAHSWWTSVVVQHGHMVALRAHSGCANLFFA